MILIPQFAESITESLNEAERLKLWYVQTVKPYVFLPVFAEHIVLERTAEEAQATCELLWPDEMVSEVFDEQHHYSWKGIY